MAKATRFSYCLFLILFTSGCGNWPAGMPFARSPDYLWGMHNATKRTVRFDSDATYSQGDLKDIDAIGGTMLPDGRRTSGPGLDPIPVRVHVLWFFEDDNKPHEADVLVAGHIPDEAHFSGTLWLVFDDDGVHLEPETFDQRLARSIREANEEIARENAAATKP